MNEGLTTKSCIQFSELLASKDPVPGGGAAAALVGALGIALCSMSGNLTLGRKKYAAWEEDVRRVLALGTSIRTRLLELIDADARNFEPLSKAYSLPKNDPNRHTMLQEATMKACQAPLEIMEQCCGAIELLEEMLDKGSSMLVSDVGRPPEALSERRRHLHDNFRSKKKLARRSKSCGATVVPCRTGTI